MRIVILSLLTLQLLVPAQARAQYARIELKILGMDCAICAHGVRVAIQKVDGVESVELSLERAEADIRLRSNNRVSLDQFRRIVKANGFESRQATVAAIGTTRDAGGELAFEVSGQPTAFIVSPDRSAPAPYKQLKAAFDSKSTALFEIVGTVEKRVGKKGDKKGADVDAIAIASVTESR